MRIEYDQEKNQRNITERSLPFDDAVFFEFDNAVINKDVRTEYPEPRFVATGYLDDRVHVLCFTPISGGIRVISFRKANKREVNRFES